MTPSRDNYCPEIDTNLLSLGTLEAKGLHWGATNGLLEVKDQDGDVVMQATRVNQVYPLNQPAEDYNMSPKAYATNKKAVSKEVWHARLGHVNYKDLFLLPKIAEGIEISNASKDQEFCEACILGKQHKIHSKSPPSQRALVPGERLHCDLFGGGDTLPGVANIKYGVLIVDDASRIKIPITLKTKDAICPEVEHAIKRVET